MTALMIRALFGVLLVIVFYGWGTLLNDLLRRCGASPRLAPRGAPGLALVLAVGGTLNLAAMLTSAVYVALGIVGIVYAAIGASRFLRNKPRDGRWLTIVAVVAILALPIYVASLHFLPLNPHDDCQSYLVMAVRVLQTGTSRPDPFNLRSMLSGPGGMAFLQAPVIGLFGVNASHLVDAGAGLLLFIGAAATFTRRFKLSAPIAIVLIGGSLVLAQHQLVNITSYFTTLALLIALFHVLLDTEDDSIARPVQAALLLTGIASLKEIALAVGLTLCALAALESLVRRRPHAVRNTIVALIVLTVVASIWFVPRMQTHARLISLTYGDGPEQANLRFILQRFTITAWDWVYLVVFVIAAGAALWIARRRDDRFAALFTIVAVIVGAAVMTYVTGGAAITRYNQPLFLIGYLVCSTILLSNLDKRVLCTAAVLILCAGFIAFRETPPTSTLHDDIDAIVALRDGTSTIFPSADRAEAACRAQNAMEPGAVALVRTDFPFLFDFARNPMYVLDHPGSASLPPGLPDGDDAEMVRYLQANHIRYLVYAYGNEANFPAVDIERRLASGTLTPWQRAWHRPIPIVQVRMRSVAAHWPDVYDDGHTVVVDVSRTP